LPQYEAPPDPVPRRRLRRPAAETISWYQQDRAQQAGVVRHSRDRDLPMQFMVIETFRNQDAKAVYRRFRDKGRMVPDGVTFVASWVSADLGRCFQIMECEDVALLQRWVTEWSDLIGFEIVPVVAGKDTAAALAAQL
jgi:hypothetical protein